MVFDNSKEQENRFDVIFMGRLIGTANAWDQVDDDSILFYDFIPVTDLDSLPIHNEAVVLNWREGTAAMYSDRGDCTFRRQLIPFIARLPRHESIPPDIEFDHDALKDEVIEPEDQDLGDIEGIENEKVTT